MPRLPRSPAFWYAAFAVAFVLFRVALFAVDLGCLLSVYLIARRVYPDEGLPARLGRLVAYAVLTGAIGLILYDRQDLVVALFALLAVSAFLTGRPALAYAALVA